MRGTKDMKIFRKIIILFLSVLVISLYITVTNYNQKIAQNISVTNNVLQKYNEKEKSNKDAFSSKDVPLKYNDKGVCVLMYHSIDYEKNNGLRTPKEQFEKQIRYIKDNGYTTLTLNELYNFFANNKPVPKKSVVLTFDDGYLDNYKNAYPILKQYGIKATIFVITNTIDKDSKYMNSMQLRKLQNDGIDIESHTLNHEDLSSLSYERQLKILTQSKQNLEKMLDKKINYIAYPCGKYNSDTLRAARDSGYIMAFATGNRTARKCNGIFALHRIGVIYGDGIEVLAGRLQNE